MPRTFPTHCLLPCLLLTGLLAAQTPTPFFGPTDYSAVMVIHLDGGATQRMAIAKLGQMWRSTMAIPGRSGGMVQLINLKTKTAYMIMPQMCMQQSLPNLPPAGVLEAARQPDAKVTDLGPATVTSGGTSYACEHRQVTYTDNGKTNTADVYTANDLQNFPVKMVMQQNGRAVTVTYEQIDLTAPAASLFVPPAHCGGIPSVPGMMRR